MIIIKDWIEMIMVAVVLVGGAYWVGVYWERQIQKYKQAHKGENQ
jgi:hypothetical protein